MTLRLNGDNSGFTEIKAADTAGDNSIKLPADNGSANQVLKNSSTAGELEYASNLYENGGNVIVGGNSYSFAKPFNVVGATGSLISISSESTTDGAADQGPGLEFKFHDGSQVRGGGEIVVHKVNATVGNSATQMIFKTRDSSAGVQEVMKLDNDGTMHLLDGAGINFSAIQTETSATDAASTYTTLDHYEEGTWEPVLGSNTGTDFPVATNNQGWYTRVGDLVFATATFQWTTGGTIGGNVRIKGWPFACKGSANYRASAAIHNRSSGVYANGVYTQLSHGFDAGTNFTWLTMHNGTTSSGANYSHTPPVNGAGIIYGLSLTYQVG